MHVHDQNRVLALHRWVEGEGHDVIVVVHLGNFNRFDYRTGFPGGGDWREVFNSDVYENWVNANTVGNGGRIQRGAPTAARLQPLRNPRAAGEQPAGVRAVMRITKSLGSYPARQLGERSSGVPEYWSDGLEIANDSRASKF